MRLVVAGPAGVGKSSVILRKSQGIFVHSHDPNIEATHPGEVAAVAGKDGSPAVPLELYDTVPNLGPSDAAMFTAKATSFIQKAHGLILVTSFDRGEFFLEDLQTLRLEVLRILKKKTPEEANLPTMIIVNKSDIEEGDRELSAADFTKFGENMKVKVCFVSAKTGEGVDQAFKAMTQLVHTQDNEKERTMERVVKMGVLWKSGGKIKFKGWDKRWFAIIDNELLYYRSKKDMPDSPRGSIQLTVIRDVVCPTTIPAARKMADHAFDVVTSARTYTLYGATAQESHEWVAALTAVVENSPRREMTTTELAANTLSDQEEETSDETNSGGSSPRSRSPTRQTEVVVGTGSTTATATTGRSRAGSVGNTLALPHDRAQRRAHTLEILSAAAAREVAKSSKPKRNSHAPQGSAAMGGGAGAPIGHLTFTTVANLTTAPTAGAGVGSGSGGTVLQLPSTVLEEGNPNAEPTTRAASSGSSDRGSWASAASLDAAGGNTTVSPPNGGGSNGSNSGKRPVSTSGVASSTTSPNVPAAPRPASTPGGLDLTGAPPPTSTTTTTVTATTITTTTTITQA